MNTTNASAELAMALLSRVHAGTAKLPGAEMKWSELIQEAFDAEQEKATIREFQRWEVAVTSLCTCGGEGPIDGCIACKVYHAAKGLRAT